MAQLQRDKFTASRTADEVLQAATALSQDEADETIRKLKAEKEELAARVLELERELAALASGFSSPLVGSSVDGDGETRDADEVGSPRPREFSPSPPPGGEDL